MTEISRPWGGTTVGDAGPYNAPNWWDVWQAMCHSNGAVRGAGNRGVFSDISGYLQVSYLGPNFLRVASGAAMIDGLFYQNTANYDVTVTSASAGNVRDDRLVVRKYFSGSNQTARIVLLPGSEAASPGPGTPPALTQDVSRITYWDLPLARVSVADTGVITLTNEREFIFTPALVLLSSYTITDPAGETITFDNIPQTFSDLILVWKARATSSGFATCSVAVQVNDDTDDEHYAYCMEWWVMSTLSLATDYGFGTGSDAWGFPGVLPSTADAGKFGDGIIELRGYSDATMHSASGKSIANTSGGDTYDIRLALWDSMRVNPVAYTGISKLSLKTSNNGGSGNYNFDVGSEFRLYARL